MVKKGNILSSSHSHYLVKEFAGEGRFGKVVKCVKLKTSQEVAVKILKTKKNTIDNNEVNYFFVKLISNVFDWSLQICCALMSFLLRSTFSRK